MSNGADDMSTSSFKVSRSISVGVKSTPNTAPLPQGAFCTREAAKQCKEADKEGEFPASFHSTEY
jgi:hypothetical protein